MRQFKRLYVGSLPYSTTEEELKELFSKFGTIKSIRVITDKFTGLSKGFAFVELEEDEAGKKAIDALHGQAFQGRTLVVDAANEERKESRGPSSPRGGDRGERNGSWTPNRRRY